MKCPIDDKCSDGYYWNTRLHLRDHLFTKHSSYEIIETLIDLKLIQDDTLLEDD